MLFLRHPRNKFQKRLIRPAHTNTQGYPHPSVLNPALRNADGSFRRPVDADTTPVNRGGDAFVLNNGLVPGTVMSHVAASNTVAVGSDENLARKPFGLLANFVGGDFDELGDENNVGVWRGAGSVYVLLKPAYDDTGLSAAVAAATLAGSTVPLYTGPDGRLTLAANVTGGTAGNRLPVAEVLSYQSNRIKITLLV